MARRRKNRQEEIALGVVQLIALVGLAGAFFPPFRELLLATGMIIAGAVSLVAVIALAVFLIRRSQRKSLFHSTHFTNLEAAVVTEESSPFPRTKYYSPSPTMSSPPAIQLSDQLRAIDWFQFEKLIALVYRKLGYAVTRRGGANPDGGIDLVIEKSGQRSAVQCKQWKTWNVGVKAVREFLGALTDSGISKGIFITLCGYTGEAKQLAEKHGIEIVNEAGLVKMFESTDAKFDPETILIFQDTRKFCPKCESEMVLRTALKGIGSGRQFWGCSRYPRCRFTMPVG